MINGCIVLLNWAREATREQNCRPRMTQRLTRSITHQRTNREDGVTSPMPCLSTFQMSPLPRIKTLYLSPQDQFKFLVKCSAQHRCARLVFIRLKGPLHASPCNIGTSTRWRQTLPFTITTALVTHQIQQKRKTLQIYQVHPMWLNRGKFYFIWLSICMIY